MAPSYGTSSVRLSEPLLLALPWAYSIFYTYTYLSKPDFPAVISRSNL